MPFLVHLCLQRVIVYCRLHCEHPVISEAVYLGFLGFDSALGLIWDRFAKLGVVKISAFLSFSIHWLWPHWHFPKHHSCAFQDYVL